MSTPTEQALAEFYGISRKAMAGIRARHLREGWDWVQAGKTIVITEPGQKKIGALLNGGEGAELDELAVCGRGPWTLWLPTPPPIPPGPPAPPPADVHEFLIVRIPVNPRYVIAKNEAGRADFRIRVGQNSNFRQGMKIRAQRVDALDDGHWRMVGRQPRWPGRW